MADSSNTQWTDKQRKKLLERIVRPELSPGNIGRAGIVILIGALFYVLLFGDYGIWRIKSMQKEIERQNHEIELLQAAQDSLRQERWQLINDPEYVEKIAREQYGMQKEGEVVYKFYDEENPSQDSAQE